MQAPHCIKPVAAHLSDSNVKCNQRAISVISVVKVIQMCIYRRGARVSFGLWILKVKGPTLFLHNLNAEVVLIRVPKTVNWFQYG